MKSARPLAPIFQNERWRCERIFMPVLQKRSRLPRQKLLTLLRTAMTRRPAHLLLMRPFNERSSMICEILVPMVRRAELKAGVQSW